MSTITIQVGNTDNKLTQQEWSEFVKSVDVQMGQHPVHFRGGSSPDAPWQNYCWVIGVTAKFFRPEDFRNILRHLAKKYKQDSIAYTTGETEFLS
jgi:hypothetical protein